MNNESPNTVEKIAEQVARLVKQLHAAGRMDLLLKAIGAPLLEELRIEAAKAKLSRLIITEDYRFILADYQKEIELQPVHNPLDNAINEKCSRIKKTILSMMDEYTASYYIISSHTQKHFEGSNRIWYERLKIITLPRELVVLLHN